MADVSDELVAKATAFFKSRFCNRTDTFAVQLGKGAARASGNLDEVLRSHILGTPCELTIHHSDGRTSSSGSAWRVGCYTPGLDGLTKWLGIDFDAAGTDHKDGLVDAQDAALKTQAVFSAYGIPSILERSKSGRGWHLWVFFEPAVQAGKARALALALIPRIFKRESGELADPSTGKGVEIFPKQEHLEPGKFGSQIYLPLHFAAANGCNRFYSATGTVMEGVPEVSTVPPEAVDALLAQVQPPAPPPAKTKPVVRSKPALERFEDARKEFNLDHPLGAKKNGGPCPIKGCDGKNSCKGDDIKANCFHSSHPQACGTLCSKGGSSCRVFDPLDREAFETGRPARAILEERGYLQRYKPPEEPPLPGDEDCPPDLRDWHQPVDQRGQPAGLPVPTGTAPASEQPAPRQSKQSEWPEPESLDLQLLPVVAFDAKEMLPEAFVSYVMDCAYRAQTPADLVAVPLVIAAGSVIGRQVAIRPLERDPNVEFANAYGAGIQDPSAKKSMAMAMGLAPLDRLTSAAYEEVKEALEAFKKDQAVYEAEAKALKRLIEKAAQANDAEQLAELKEKIAPEPIPPFPRRFKVTDCTPEKLGMLLLENPNGLLLAVDELAGWLYQLERDGHQSERKLYLTGQSGKAPHDVDRVGRASIHIPALCLSVFGTIQPGVWASYVREALESKAGADGFLQRFQLAVWPDRLPRVHLVDQCADYNAIDRVHHIFDLLAHLDPKAIGAEKGEYDKVPYLRFGKDAQPYVKKFLSDHMERWHNSNGDEHPALISHMLKMPKTFAGLCLTFHLVDWICGGPDASCEIGTGPVSRALAWVDYLESHARRIYGCALKEDKNLLMMLSGKLSAGALNDGFTVRDIQRKDYPGLNSADTIKGVLGKLEEAGWIKGREVRTGRRGPPRNLYAINPKVLPDKPGEKASAA